MAGSSYSSGGSSSTGSFIPNYEQSDFLQQVAETAASMANSMFDWSQGVYSQIGSLTNQVVDSAISQSQAAGGFAAATLDRYHSIFQPLEDQLAADANQYASGDRIHKDMGRAEAGAAQGSEAGIKNAEQHLSDLGIDVSGGRYADLEMTARTNQGAAAAAAGENARINAENTGRTLRGEAIKVGQEYPKQALSAMQTGIQGLNTASGALAANANAAANLGRLPNDFLKTASELKYPPLGTGPSSSSNISGSNQTDKDSGGGSGDGSDGGGSKAKGGGGGGGSGGDPYASGGGGGGSDMGGFRQPTGQDPNNPNYNGDQSYDESGMIDAYGGQDYDNNSYYSGDAGSYGSGYDGEYTQYDGGGGGADYSGTDTGGGDMSYAMGGPVQGQGGGMIPTSASPSRGAVQDDVQINAQPHEFIIPRDVAMWKGQEFFQKMIMQARAQRTGAPAHGTRPRGR